MKEKTCSEETDRHEHGCIECPMDCPVKMGKGRFAWEDEPSASVKGGIVGNMDAVPDAAVLHDAVLHSGLEQVKKLIESGVDVNLPDNNGKTPLHLSVTDDNKIGTSRFLIEKGANVEARDRFHLTPLHWAMVSGSRETVKMLVEKGADVSAKDRWANLTPVEWAEREGLYEMANMVRLLIR